MTDTAKPMLVRRSRGVATLMILGLLTATVLASPVGGAPSKKKVRRIATKVFNGRFPGAFADALSRAETSGHFSCNALTWQESNTTPGFATGGTNGMARTSNDSGSFSCNVALPHGATITGVRFAVYDQNPSSNMGPCTLRRLRLTAPIGSGGTMLDAGSSSGSPGDMTLSSTAVSDPVVDNDNFSYLLSCAFASSGGALGVYGAIVDYEVGGAEGIAA
jgi:hypothetical protein